MEIRKMINKQMVTNKQLIALIVFFFGVAGSLYYVQLISKIVLLALFWTLGGIIVIAFSLKLVDGVTDVIVQTKTKFAEAEKNGKRKTGNETDSGSSSEQK